MNNAFIGGLTNNTHERWVWWRYFDDGLKDWKASPTAWRKIPDGTLAQEIFVWIEKVYNAFQKDGKLELLE